MATLADDDEASIEGRPPTTIAEAAARAFMTPLLHDDNDEGCPPSAAPIDMNHDRIRRRLGAASLEVTFQDLEHSQSVTTPFHSQSRHRILDRSGTFRQSRGHWGVERLLRSGGDVSQRGQSQLQQQESDNYQLSNVCFTSTSCCRVCCYCFRRLHQEWGKDWFFWLAYQKTWVLFILLFVSYLTIICFFGFIYLGLSIMGSKTEVNPDGSTKIIAFCDMDITDHMEAMYFSLSTMTTIGYGVSDYYFGGCYSPLLIVLWQVCTAIVFDAVAVGLIFHRISRGEKRSRSILFSDKAVVRRIRGVPYLMFRLGERRKYHLIEATIRVYCIRHERLPVGGVALSIDRPNLALSDKGKPRAAGDGSSNSNKRNPEHNTPARTPIETSHFVSRQIRLIQPDDRYGSHVWMGLPQVVVHRIDESSPLMPSSPLWFDAQGMSHSFAPTSTQFEGASSTSSVISETKSSTGLDPLAPSESSSSSVVQEQANDHELFSSIYEFLTDRDAELVVLVEGTDEGTGAAIQARHSYKTSDIAWNRSFAECVHPYNGRHRSGPSDLDPVVSIDFNKFHDTVPAPIDCHTCAYVPQEAS